MQKPMKLPDLEEYTATVLFYINSRLGNVTVEKTIETMDEQRGENLLRTRKKGFKCADPKA